MVTSETRRPVRKKLIRSDVKSSVAAFSCSHGWLAPLGVELSERINLECHRARRR